MESVHLIRLLWGLREIINANVLRMVKAASDGMHVLWWWWQGCDSQVTHTPDDVNKRCNNPLGPQFPHWSKGRLG